MRLFLAFQHPCSSQYGLNTWTALSSHRLKSFDSSLSISKIISSWCDVFSKAKGSSIPSEESSLWWGIQILKVFSPPVFRSETLFKRRLASKTDHLVQTSNNIFRMISKQGRKKTLFRSINTIYPQVPHEWNYNESPLHLACGMLASLHLFRSVFREPKDSFLGLEWSDIMLSCLRGKMKTTFHNSHRTKSLVCTSFYATLEDRWISPDLDQPVQFLLRAKLWNHTSYERSKECCK